MMHSLMSKVPGNAIVLGVLIPTRNREEFLVHAVKSALRFAERCSFEVIVVVANNGDDNFSAETLEEITRSGVIVLTRPPSVLSMAKNWHRGFEYTLSTRVTHLAVLGDDDFLIAPSREFSRALLAGFDAVICDRVARSYRWENESSPPRIVIARPRNPKRAEVLRSDPERMFEEPVLYSLAPSPYQGFVRMSALQKIVDEYGVLSPARAPDVFLSYALSCLPGLKWISLRKPFMVNGTSPKSTGASALGQSKSKKASQEFHVLSRGEIRFPSTLPGLETFPSLFVATTEVFDWAQSKKPEMRSVDIRKVLHGMARSAYLAGAEDVKKLMIVAKDCQVDLSLSPSQNPPKRSSEFDLFYFGFSLEVKNLSPSAACRIAESRLAIILLLARNCSVIARSVPANMLEFARWLYRRFGR
jgi:Glycosyl transferase family 2